MSAPVSRPLPPSEAVCGVCGHDGAEHHHAVTACWAQLPRGRRADGTAGPVALCECRAFVPKELETLREQFVQAVAELETLRVRLEKRTDLLHTVQATARRLRKEADGRKAHGDRLKAENERLCKDRDAFREQRNAVFATNERLLVQVQESGQARLRAENEVRTARREADALQARVAELEAALLLANTQLGDAALAVERAVDSGEALVDVADMADALGLDANANPLRVEGEHYAATHHPYRLGRDLPAQTTTPMGDPR